jgi:hypothetical protein
MDDDALDFMIYKEFKQQDRGGGTVAAAVSLSCC